MEEKCRSSKLINYQEILKCSRQINSDYIFCVKAAHKSTQLYNKNRAIPITAIR